MYYHANGIKSVTYQIEIVRLGSIFAFVTLSIATLNDITLKY
jgi:hypothetical protein